jgi:hypothetical protein
MHVNGIFKDREPVIEIVLCEDQAVKDFHGREILTRTATSATVSFVCECLNLAPMSFEEFVRYLLILKRDECMKYPQYEHRAERIQNKLDSSFTTW